MKLNVKKDRKIVAKKLMILLLISAFSGIIVMFLNAGYSYVKCESKGKYVFDLSNIRTEGDVESIGGVFRITKNGGIIDINIPKQYISKLTFEYASVGFSGCEVHIVKDNIYGIEKEEVIKDNFMQGMPRSVLNINGCISKISIQCGENDNIVEIKNIGVDNSFKINPLLALYIATLIFLLGFIVVFEKENAKNPAIAAFVIIIVLGSCLLLVEPPHIVGWDEQIHFRKAYTFDVKGENVQIPKAVDYIYDYAPLINDYSNGIKEPIEERLDEIRYFNNQMQQAGSIVENNHLQINSLGYLFQAIALKVATVFNLNFYLLWLSGKFANILLYAIIMSIGIHIIPIAKRLLFAISILPTMLFQSTTYTYDVTVIAFIILTSCILVREFICDDKKFRYRSRIGYIFSMVVGCMPKAVYAPLVLGAVFLPKKKFYSKKESWIWRLTCVLTFLALMMTFVLPTLIAPSETGDARGGDTSEAGQMSYVLGSPFCYAVVFLKNVVQTLPDYILGADVMTNFAYMGIGSLAVVYSAYLVMVLLTDRYGEGKYAGETLAIKVRIITMIQIALVVALIWTALYLSYTEVGEEVIAGVQARYYLPFFLLLFICFQNKKIKCDISEEKYQLGISIIGVLLIMQQIFQLVLMQSL